MRRADPCRLSTTDLMVHHITDYHGYEPVCQGPAPNPPEGVTRVRRPLAPARRRLPGSRPREADGPADDAGLGQPLRYPWPSYRLIGVAELAAFAGVLAGHFWLPMGVAAASGMAVLLVGALTVHRRVGDRLQQAAPAALALAASLAYLAVASTR